MRTYLATLICVCVIISELASASSSSLAWRNFKRQHNKVYEAEEDAARFAIFLATKQFVERHNANSSATFKMGLNHMSDWTREEYQRLNGFKLGKARNWAQNAAAEHQFRVKLEKLIEGPVPDEVDWRKVPNRVTSVKNQGQCGSCWAFSTTGLLEGQQVARNMSKLVALSEQQLIDCSFSNYACRGGDPLVALQDLATKMHGIESEEDYKYESDRHLCREDKTKFVMTNTGGHHLTMGDEDELKRVVANYGPVSLALNAADYFISYKSGVLYDPICSPNHLNHAVLAVGYGHDAKGGDYWLVKNSWGTNWGEEGYCKIKRGVNMCGISMYPVVADF